MYDIVIIGAGPAGLSAAIYAQRAEKKTLVLEAKNYGGQIINAQEIENYPGLNHISGYEFATKLINQAKDLGTKIIFEKAIKINNFNNYKEVITTENKYKTKTVILATGADNRKLGISNENTLIGKGISYCAVCDGAFYKKQTVAVLGGGNTALEEALFLSSIASKVYLIHRRDSFKADSKTVNKVKKQKNIELLLNYNITELKAKEKLDSIIIINKENEIQELKVSALFVAIGKVPSNENFSQLIKTDEKGYIITDENCHTNIEGIFGAGDARVKMLRQLVTATSDGAIAATEAVKYINRKERQSDKRLSNL